MASRRRYTAKQKAELVALAAVEGVTEASRISEVPKTTIQYWTEQPEFAQLRTTAREKVEEAFNVAIQVGLRALMSNWQQASLKDQAYALGVIYDRHALMTGSATSRTESRELNDLPDSTYVEAIREFEAITRAGSPSPSVPAEDEPVS